MIEDRIAALQMYEAAIEKFQVQSTQNTQNTHIATSFESPAFLSGCLLKSISAG